MSGLGYLIDICILGFLWCVFLKFEASISSSVGMGFLWLLGIE
jgi:hypothetical protein